MPILSHNTVSRETLQQLASLAGSSASLTPTPAPNAKPTASKPDLIHGHFSAHKSPSGILIHTMDAHETQHFESRVRLSPCLSFCVLLEGTVEFILNDIEHRFSASAQAPTAFAMNILAPSDWTRLLKKDRYVCKVVVSLPYAWLKSRVQLGSSFSQQVDELMQKHMRVLNWSASDELKATAIDVLRLSKDTQDDLLLESKALEFIGRSLKQVNPNTGSLANRNINASARRIQAHLESNIIVDSAILKPNLTALSTALGISTSSLQRNFKRQFNQTIFDYVRTRKLENARDYLKQENASIGEAAYRAGYKHGPNFSKAFKRAFGLSPGAYAKQR